MMKDFKFKRNKISIKKEFVFSNISKLNIAVGIFLFVFSALSIYSFFYIIRETFRVSSITQDGDFWILSKNELNFYNLFFAFLSFIFAQSIVINFWMNKPRKFFQQRNLKRKIIINDNRFLNWNFISWFAKISIVYAIMFGLVFNKGYYVFSFYKDYKHIFIIIVLVLFLQTWVSIRILYKNSFKWMFFSAVIISISAFILSQINIIDSEKMDESLKKKCIICNYDIQLPQTQHFEKHYSMYRTENVFIVKNYKNEVVIILDNRIVELRNLSKEIKNMEKKNYGYSKKYFRLNIDKRVKMDFVNELKTELSNSNIFKVFYAVNPKHLEYDKKYYNNFSIYSIIHRGYQTCEIESFQPIKPYDLNDNIKSHKSIFIKKGNSEKYICNKKLISKNNIEKCIGSFIKNNDNYLICIEIDENSDFNEYISILVQCQDVLNDFRDYYSYKKFNKPFEDLYGEQQYEIIKRFPMNIIDLTNEMMKQIK